MKTIKVNEPVLMSNNREANLLRKAFKRTNTFVINIIASPGAGKTSFIESTIEKLDKKIRVAVIEGDPYTNIDAERIENKGVKSVQINTYGGCHLDAKMIQKALKNIDLEQIDLLIIENVGNLLCPTGWDLGENLKIVVASIAEGDDKPLKYPEVFQTADVIIINKIDLESFIPAQKSVVKNNALRINPKLKIFETSCTTNTGIKKWLSWLANRLGKS